MPFACTCAPAFHGDLAAVTNADDKIEISCGQLPRLKSLELHVRFFWQLVRHGPQLLQTSMIQVAFWTVALHGWLPGLLEAGMHATLV